MNILENIEPKNVMRFFEELCRIPHGSSDTKAISDYCVAFAVSRNLDYFQDEFNNVVIYCPATEGYETSPAVIIQGHLDMVCEKEHGTDFNFKTDALNLTVNGDYISAEGTTLGSDDGIAVAMALAVMDDSSISHPKIEALFTVDEEIGMLGASAFDFSKTSGRLLINIDSEVEGVFTAGCAGGACTSAIIPVKRIKKSGSIYKIIIDGLTGGHSGIEIDKGRGNANILMGRVLYAVSEKHPVNLIALEGGMKDNAIPLSATATVMCDGDISEIITAFNSIFKNEYRVTDRNVTLKAQLLGSYAKSVLDSESTYDVISFLISAPNGIQSMSSDITGLVQTSLNLGILRLDDTSMTACFSVRSSIESEKQFVNSKIKTLSALCGGKTDISGEYPAWEYKENSRLRSVMTDVFERQYGHDPVIDIIHAGLECGIFSGKRHELDCVSFGPDLLEIHTTRERMSISSVQRVWKFLLEVLKELK